jgi:hypothetical protein
MLGGGLSTGGGEEVVLEPSLAAFKLEAAADATGRRYVGNNFGQPHRDYTYADVYHSDGNGPGNHNRNGDGDGGSGGGGGGGDGDSVEGTPPGVVS